MDAATFNVRAGEVVGLLGPNGSGKTTIIRLLNGLLRPDGGRARVAGVDPLENGARVRRKSGVLTETAAFYSHLSGIQNLRFYAELYGVESTVRPGELLKTFGLADAAEKLVGTYSTGMRKRLGLAKALLNEPELLFLDEPTNGLDPAGARLVLKTIRELQQLSGTTVLISSHMLDHLEVVCDRYLFIKEGRLVEEGTLPDLRAAYQQGVVLEVLTDLPFGEGVSEYQGTRVQPVKDGAPPVSAVGEGVKRLAFELASTAAVPDLLRQLSADASLYGARVLEPNLTDLYFMIQEKAGRRRS